MNLTKIKQIVQILRIFFETKNEGCKGVMKFYLALMLLLIMLSAVVTVIDLLGKDHIPGDHTFFMITASFFLWTVTILLTPSKEKYKSTSEKFTAYKEAKKYIAIAYKLLVVEILFRLLSDGDDLWKDLYALTGLVAVIMAIWFALSALIVFFIHHEIMATHKFCYKKLFKKVEKEKKTP